MGKLVVSSCVKQLAVAEPAGYLTLRSGRRVPAAGAAACSPRTMSRSQCRRGGPSELRRCGSNTRRKGVAGVRQRYRVVSSQLLTGGGRSMQEEAPAPEKATSAVDRDHGCSGDHRQHTLLISGEASSKQHQHCEANGGAADQLMTRSSPPEAEMEAFFAAAELAQRRRFAETYNYDVALDRPLQGRFEWTPVST